jgi:hypothetical protein
MRHPAAVVVVCRRCVKEAGPDLEALTRVLKAPAVLVAPVTPVAPVAAVARPTSAVPVAAVPATPVVRVVPAAVRATSVVPVVLAVPVVRATSVVRVVPAVVRATSAAQVVPAVVRATSAAQVVPVVRATSAGRVVRVTSVDPVIPATSDRGLPTPSAASVVPRGAMEQRRGAGEHRRGPGGVGPSPRRAECGTKGRSTTGATTSNRYGIRAKTVGASISSESGSRCNQPAGWAVVPQMRGDRPSGPRKVEPETGRDGIPRTLSSCKAAALFSDMEPTHPLGRGRPKITTVARRCPCQRRGVRGRRSGPDVPDHL